MSLPSATSGTISRFSTSNGVTPVAETRSFSLTTGWRLICVPVCVTSKMDAVPRMPCLRSFSVFAAGRPSSQSPAIITNDTTIQI